MLLPRITELPQELPKPPKEWLDASLFDAVRANRNRGLHLSMVRILLKQLLEQLKVLQEFGGALVRGALWSERELTHVCSWVYVMK